MAVASYGSATKSSGVVRILKDLDAVIEGRDVLIVEDIVDSGLTLQYLLRNLAGPQPALARGLRAADQARAPQGRSADALRRFEIPNRFAIGYGLDHAERYRNLPYVAALKRMMSAYAVRTPHRAAPNPGATLDYSPDPSRRAGCAELTS